MRSRGPLDVLPVWLRPAALALAPTHVFEGLRALAFEKTLRLDLMAVAFALNIVYFIVSAFIFHRLLASARRAGSLLQMGE